MGQSTLCSQRIELVDILAISSICKEDGENKSAERILERENRLRILTLEVPCKRNRSTQTLNRRVHVAGIAEILETAQSDHTVVETHVCRRELRM